MQIIVPEKFTGISYGTTVDSRFPGTTTIGNINGPVHYLGDSIYTHTTNKDWRQQVARKQDASVDYTRSRFEYKPSVYHAFSTMRAKISGVDVSIDSRYRALSLFGYSQIQPSSSDTVLQDLALGRFKRRLSSDIGKVNALIPLIELREMRGLIRQLTFSATNLMKALLHIKRTKGKSAVKFASDAWLAWSFAIKPGLNDVESISQAIADYLLRSDHNFTTHGSASKTWLVGQRSLGVSGPYGTTSSECFSGVATLSYRYVGGLNVKFKTANNYGLAGTFGFTFEDLPSTMWELVPFSWVVDYFTTMGAYLEDVFQLPPGNLIYLNLCKRYTLRGICSYRNYQVQNADGVLLTVTDCRDGSLGYTHFSRQKLTAIPHRSLRFKTVDEIGINAVNRLLNLSALLAPDAYQRSRKAGIRF